MALERVPFSSYKYFDELNQLKSIGFTDDRAMKKALDEANGDINTASILLLDQAKVNRQADIERAMAIADSDYNVLGNVELAEESKNEVYLLNEDDRRED